MPRSILMVGLAISAIGASGCVTESPSQPISINSSTRVVDGRIVTDRPNKPGENVVANGVSTTAPVPGGAPVTGRIIGLVPSKAASAVPSKPPEDAPLSDVDRASILSASADLRRLLKVEPTAGRALPLGPPLAAQCSGECRLVELDTTEVGMKVTYTFLCLTTGRMTLCQPLGRK
jgi:hypothetical protein